MSAELPSRAQGRNSEMSSRAQGLYAENGTPERRPGGLVIDGQVERGSFRLDLALDLAPGRVTGLLGPNGAGKTTALRTMCGLTPMTSGSLHLDGIPLDDVDAGIFVPPEHRPVGVVFQDYRLFPHLDVRDNVAFGARARGVGRESARAAADAWLERLDLSGLATRRPAALSGGQAQRVALARALATEPAALLLDEPLAALDARTRLGIRAELRDHLRTFAGPVVMVTHDAVEALVLADDLVVIEAGRITQRGTPSEVARRPRTDYVARLMGVNLYRGSLDRSTHSVDLLGGGRLVVTGADQLSEVSDVLVTLAPTAVTLHAERPDRSSPRNVWAGVVRAMEPLGERVRVEVAGPPDALVDVTPAAVADLALHPGSPVWLSAKATETYAA